MKTITIDLSGATVTFPDGKVIGCEGTHNAVSLRIILPDRLISAQISAYTLVFLNGNGELICSGNLTPAGSVITCPLWDQLLCGRELSVQVQAVGFKNEEIEIIDKTPVIVLEIERSLDGIATQTRTESDSILAQLAHIKEIIKELEIEGATDYESLTNKPFEYVYDAFLDDMLDEGLYLADKYAYTENGQHTGWTTGRDTAVFIRNVDYEKTMARMPIIGQIVSTPFAVLTRQYDKSSGTWSEMSTRKYVSDLVPIVPLTEVANGDGTIAFDLTGVPPILRELDKTRRVLETGSDCSFILPVIYPIQAGEFSVYPEQAILVYAHFTQDVSIDWGSDVMFYDGEVPTIGQGYFDIIFTFDPNALKWCVGVIPKGDAE